MSRKVGKLVRLSLGLGYNWPVEFYGDTVSKRLELEYFNREVKVEYRCRIKKSKIKMNQSPTWFGFHSKN